MSKISEAKEEEIRAAIARVDCQDVIKIVLRGYPTKVLFGVSNSQTKSGSGLYFSPCELGGQRAVYWTEVKSVRIFNPEELALLAKREYEEEQKKKRKKK